MVSKFFINLVTIFIIAPTIPSSSARNGFDCKDNIDGNYPNPENCVTFTQCEGGQEIGWVCLADLFYNPNVDLCLWPDVLSCVDYPVPRNCSQTHSHGFVPTTVRDRCKSFIECSTGQVHECPRDTRFNPLRRGCENSTNFKCAEDDDEDSQVLENFPK